MLTSVNVAHRPALVLTMLVHLPLTASLTEAQTPSQGSRVWPEDIRKVEIPGSLGEKPQPALFWTAPGETPAPLLVGLHTWSSNFHQTGSSLPYQQWCRLNGWHFIHPDFGGPNVTPRAMGSDGAVADVVRAVAWAKEHAHVDPERVYLIGVSGGGHMALLMAARHPELWAGVSAWCGISDIAQWHADCRANPRFARYADNIESALGGPPDTAARQKDAARRSPVTWLAEAHAVPLDIQAGVHDGRLGSVPFSHSLRAWNAVVGATAALPEAFLENFYSTQKSREPAPPTDALYGRRPPVFQRAHRNARVTIFEGGHEIIHSVALNWLAQQRQGQAAVWEVREPVPFDVEEENVQSGK